MDLPKLKSQLLKHEGLRLKIYNDSLGIPTIGVGRNLQGVGISESEAMLLLDNDIKTATDFLNKSISWWNTLDEVRQRVLVDMAFNLGRKLLQFAKMLKAIEAKDWHTASQELLSSKFAQQVGNRATNLAKMLLTGVEM